MKVVGAFLCSKTIKFAHKIPQRRNIVKLEFAIDIYIKFSIHGYLFHVPLDASIRGVWYSGKEPRLNAPRGFLFAVGK